MASLTRSFGSRSHIKVALSYAFDWVILIGFAAVGFILGDVTPNKRPFSVINPDISFPFTEHETVPPWLLLVCSSAIPIVLVLVVSLIFVPGPNVPKGTPPSLIWKRRLWELHTGWLGLALSLVSTWFITSGMKNLYGKPRPDLLSRCDPDLENLDKYFVGGIPLAGLSTGQLVSADICRTTDIKRLEDGFRSYPSGHSSSSAAGLIYLSLFLASKFNITLPFLARPDAVANTATSAAFPSRSRMASSSRFDVSRSASPDREEELTESADPDTRLAIAQHTKLVHAARRQAAAPPLYLLGLVALPSCGAVFIASSRWFDFRHHGFDILFGFLIGLICAIFSFRYYHMPISQGAGWAWGPRSRDKAFWAGLGSYSYATDHDLWVRHTDEEVGLEMSKLAGRQDTAEQSGRAGNGRAGEGSLMTERLQAPTAYKPPSHALTD